MLAGLIYYFRLSEITILEWQISLNGKNAAKENGQIYYSLLNEGSHAFGPSHNVSYIVGS